MTRLVLQSLLLFSLPFIAYALYMMLLQRGRLLESAPWYWLSLSGLILACGGLVALVVTGGVEPGGTYVPPHMDESGRIVPGGVRRDDG
jgi:Family of unknown function (DUF6111)